MLIEMLQNQLLKNQPRKRGSNPIQLHKETHPESML
jgi:hypothetical protein